MAAERELRPPAVEITLAPPSPLLAFRRASSRVDPLSKLLDEYHLIGRPLGDRQRDDAWIDQLCGTISYSSREQAAEAAAAALAEGMSSEAVGKAISLAANQIVLRDRDPRAHGATQGVHGSDSANAWRNIARVTNSRKTMASLIVGAYQLASAGQFQQDPYPLASHCEMVKAEDPNAPLRDAEEAIRANDQGHACAAILRYGELGHPARPVFDLLLRYPGLFMNRSVFFKTFTWKRCYGYLAQNTAQISRNALASGLCDDCRNRA